jgi:hypothetical protein
MLEMMAKYGYFCHPTVAAPPASSEEAASRLGGSDVSAYVNATDSPGDELVRMMSSNSACGKNALVALVGRAGSSSEPSRGGSRDDRPPAAVAAAASALRVVATRNLGDARGIVGIGGEPMVALMSACLAPTKSEEGSGSARCPRIAVRMGDVEEVGSMDVPDDLLAAADAAGFSSGSFTSRWKRGRADPLASENEKKKKKKKKKKKDRPSSSSSSTRQSRGNWPRAPRLPEQAQVPFEPHVVFESPLRARAPADVAPTTARCAAEPGYFGRYSSAADVPDQVRAYVAGLGIEVCDPTTTTSDAAARCGAYGVGEALDNARARVAAARTRDRELARAVPAPRASETSSDLLDRTRVGGPAQASCMGELCASARGDGGNDGDDDDDDDDPDDWCDVSLGPQYSPQDWMASEFRRSLWPGAGETCIIGGWAIGHAGDISDDRLARALVRDLSPIDAPECERGPLCGGVDSADAPGAKRPRAPKASRASAEQRSDARSRISLLVGSAGSWSDGRAFAPVAYDARSTAAGAPAVAAALSFACGAARIIVDVQVGPIAIDSIQVARDVGRALGDALRMRALPICEQGSDDEGARFGCYYALSVSASLFEELCRPGDGGGDGGGGPQLTSAADRRSQHSPARDKRAAAKRALLLAMFRCESRSEMLDRCVVATVKGGAVSYSDTRASDPRALCGTGARFDQGSDDDDVESLCAHRSAKRQRTAGASADAAAARYPSTADTRKKAARADAPTLNASRKRGVAILVDRREREQRARSLDDRALKGCGADDICSWFCSLPLPDAGRHRDAASAAAAAASESRLVLCGAMTRGARALACALESGDRQLLRDAISRGSATRNACASADPCGGLCAEFDDSQERRCAVQSAAAERSDLWDGPCTACALAATGGGGGGTSRSRTSTPRAVEYDELLVALVARVEAGMRDEVTPLDIAKIAARVPWVGPVHAALARRDRGAALGAVLGLAASALAASGRPGVPLLAMEGAVDVEWAAEEILLARDVSWSGSDRRSARTLSFITLVLDRCCHSELNAGIDDSGERHSHKTVALCVKVAAAIAEHAARSPCSARSFASGHASCPWAHALEGALSCASDAVSAACSADAHAEEDDRQLLLQSGASAAATAAAATTAAASQRHRHGHLESIAYSLFLSRDASLPALQDGVAKSSASAASGLLSAAPLYMESLVDAMSVLEESATATVPAALESAEHAARLGCDAALDSFARCAACAAVGIAQDAAAVDGNALALSRRIAQIDPELVAHAESCARNATAKRIAVDKKRDRIVLSHPHVCGQDA